MTPFFCYTFVKTDMSGVEQVGLSNREYSPDSNLHSHLAAEQSLIVLSQRQILGRGNLPQLSSLQRRVSLIDTWRTFLFYCKCGVHIH